ncbi:HPP family protein [Streptomyces bomunensis]|uniref:HPP family protein n=2 Tax=Streptomyces montanisoli TaxID=2798581 RepID=A0A940MPK8_9ACTN|nr:HPP family protein [Streptomyces montanisoli]
MLTTTLGPTAYVVLAHPDTEGAKLRNSVLGHATATACGLACLAVFGLWSHPSVAVTQHDTWTQIGAQALSVGVTLLVLTLLGAYHPPAAATALLITSGIAKPGPQLYGMLAGLALLIAGAALLAKVPGARTRARDDGQASAGRGDREGREG